MVHPHARGAYGKLRRERQGCRRFIPTHVGLTSRRVLMLPTTEGSSPRTWGLLLLRGYQHRQLRFIPTHVGLTQA